MFQTVVAVFCYKRMKHGIAVGSPMCSFKNRVRMFKQKFYGKFLLMILFPLPAISQ